LQSILGALGQGTGQFAGTMGGGFGMKNLFGG
jgi:hypothetical protein